MIPRLSFDLKDIPKKKEFDTVERFLWIMRVVSRI